MMMKNFKIFITSILSLSIFISCTDDNQGVVSNNLFISGFEQVEDIVVKADDNALERTLLVSMAKLEDKDVSLQVNAQPNLLGKYNMGFYDSAIILPADNYEFETNNLVITSGNISEDVTINFKNLNNLDREERYVLPVSISASGTTNAGQFHLKPSTFSL